jgi:hypothetical protein
VPGTWAAADDRAVGSDYAGAIVDDRSRLA